MKRGKRRENTEKTCAPVEETSASARCISRGQKEVPLILKKLLILLGTLLMLMLPAFAEDIPADTAALMQSAHPRHTLSQVVSASEPVIAVMSEGEHHVLCVAEKVNGAWTLTVDNPNALWDGELPTFLWEGGMALYYSYTHHDSDKVTCHAEWQNGQWGHDPSGSGQP